MLYDYSFCVWPDEESPHWNAESFLVFGSMRVRIAFAYSEKEFNDFREALSKVGLTLREIERVPFHAPEVVL